MSYRNDQYVDTREEAEAIKARFEADYRMADGTAEIAPCMVKDFKTQSVTPGFVVKTEHYGFN